MKRLCLLSLMMMLAAFSNIFAAEIGSYQELTSAMQAGNHFVIILDLKQCTGKSNMPTGYFMPDSMLLMPATEATPESLTTSHLQFTDHLGTPTYEYLKFRFNSDNSVVIRIAIYDPQNFKLISTPKIFNCSFGNGIEIKVPN